VIPYLIYIIIHVILLLASISGSAVAVAFPNIISTFNSSLVLTSWVLSIYQLVSTISSVLFGKISDIIGMKTTFVFCSVIFTLGSFLSAIAPNIYLLIFFRLIQSIGGGGLFTVVLGIIADIFPQSRQKAIGLSVSIVAAGGVIGPSIGGWLITAWDWRSIFWVNVPIGILACTAVWILLKADKGHPGKIDYLGGGLLSGALLAVMSGLSQIRNENTVFSWMIVAILLLAGLVLIILFVRQEKKTSSPIVEMDLLDKKPFAQLNVFNFVFGITLAGFTSFLPLFAISQYKLTTLQSSFILSARSIGIILATVAASFLVSRWGYRRPLIIGSIISSLGILIMGTDPSRFNLMVNGSISLIILSLVALVSGLGIGIISFCSMNSCIDLLPQRVAFISGVRLMFLQSGGAISIAAISLTLQNIANRSLGFEISFWGLGLLGLAVIPLVKYFPAQLLKGAAAKQQHGVEEVI
jgi:MFS family permease